MTPQNPTLEPPQTASDEARAYYVFRILQALRQSIRAIDEDKINRLNAGEAGDRGEANAYRASNPPPPPNRSAPGTARAAS